MDAGDIADTGSVVIDVGEVGAKLLQFVNLSCIRIGAD